MRSWTSLLGALALTTALPANAQERPGVAERPTAESLLAEARAGADYDACLRDAELRRAELGPVDPAGAPGEAPPVRRLVLAVDASGSMAARAGGETKMEAARRAARRFLGSVPRGVEVGLVAFGHKGSNKEAGKGESCRGVEAVYELGAVDQGRIAEALAGLRPAGWTPLAAAIEAAGAMFGPSEAPGEQVVWVVSDGVETCGGDPVAAARALRGGGTRAVVNIVGFAIPVAERAALEAVAEAGGGVFEEARTGGELEARLKATRRLAQTMMNEAKATSRKTLNTLAATMAVVRTRNCLNARMTQETNRLNALSAQARLAGTADEGALDEAARLLDERHEAARGLLDGYQEALEQADATMAARIEADLRRALAGGGGAE